MSLCAELKTRFVELLKAKQAFDVAYAEDSQTVGDWRSKQQKSMLQKWRQLLNIEEKLNCFFTEISNKMGPILLKKIQEKIDKREHLTKTDLRFLYLHSRWPTILKDDIKKLTDQRDQRADLIRLLNCRPTEISLTEKEALSGNIVYHYGDLIISQNSILELTFPSFISRTLDLSCLTSSTNLVFPKKNITIGRDLNINGLTSINQLIFPENMEIGWDLNLRKLRSATNLVFPDNMRIGGDVDLYNLTKAEHLIFSNNVTIGWDLNLRRLFSVSNLIFAKNVKIEGSLLLNNLISVTNLNLPDNISGIIWLSKDLPSHEITDLKQRYPQHADKIRFK